MVWFIRKVRKKCKMPRVKSQKKKGKTFHVCFHSLCGIFFLWGGITRIYYQFCHVRQDLTPSEHFIHGDSCWVLFTVHIPWSFSILPSCSAEQSFIGASRGDQMGNNGMDGLLWLYYFSVRVRFYKERSSDDTKRAFFRTNQNFKAVSSSG